MSTVPFKEISGEKFVSLEDYMKVVAKLAEAQDHVLDLFSQGTHIRPDYKNQPEKWMYDHMCLSSYESGQDYLIEQGLIKPEECSRR